MNMLSPHRILPNNIEQKNFKNRFQLGTQSRCTGTTLRGGMGREVGGGFGMGDTCTSM